jgi:hypothetical protein
MFVQPGKEKGVKGFGPIIEAPSGSRVQSSFFNIFVLYERAASGAVDSIPEVGNDI